MDNNRIRKKRNLWICPLPHCIFQSVSKEAIEKHVIEHKERYLERNERRYAGPGIQGNGSTQPVNIYDIFGVSRHSSVVEVKKAYYTLSKQFHPDKNKDDVEEAKRMQQQLNMAWSIFNDPEALKLHDEMLDQRPTESDPTSTFKISGGGPGFAKRMEEDLKILEKKWNEKKHNDQSANFWKAIREETKKFEKELNEIGKPMKEEPLKFMSREESGKLEYNDLLEVVKIFPQRAEQIVVECLPEYLEASQLFSIIKEEVTKNWGSKFTKIVSDFFNSKPLSLSHLSSESWEELETAMKSPSTEEKIVKVNRDFSLLTLRNEEEIKRKIQLLLSTRRQNLSPNKDNLIPIWDVKGLSSGIRNDLTQLQQNSTLIVPSREFNKKIVIWTPDRHGRCEVCNTRVGSPFQKFRRRHHCRSCGKLICPSCCSKRSLPSLGLYDPTRLCVECNEEAWISDGMAWLRLARDENEQGKANVEGIVATARTLYCKEINSQVWMDNINYWILIRPVASILCVVAANPDRENLKKHCLELYEQVTKKKDLKLELEFLQACVKIADLKASFWIPFMKKKDTLKTNFKRAISILYCLSASDDDFLLVFASLEKEEKFVDLFQFVQEWMSGRKSLPSISMSFSVNLFAAWAVKDTTLTLWIQLGKESLKTNQFSLWKTIVKHVSINFLDAMKESLKSKAPPEVIAFFAQRTLFQKSPPLPSTLLEIFHHLLCASNSSPQIARRIINDFESIDGTSIPNTLEFTVLRFFMMITKESLTSFDDLKNIFVKMANSKQDAFVLISTIAIGNPQLLLKEVPEKLLTNNDKIRYLIIYLSLQQQQDVEHSNSLLRLAENFMETDEIMLALRLSLCAVRDLKKNSPNEKRTLAKGHFLNGKLIEKTKQYTPETSLAAHIEAELLVQESPQFSAAVAQGKQKIEESIQSEVKQKERIWNSSSIEQRYIFALQAFENQDQPLINAYLSFVEPRIQNKLLEDLGIEASLFTFIVGLRCLLLDDLEQGLRCVQLTAMLDPTRQTLDAVSVILSKSFSRNFTFKWVNDFIQNLSKNPKYFPPIVSEMTNSPFSLPSYDMMLNRYRVLEAIGRSERRVLEEKKDSTEIGILYCGLTEAADDLPTILGSLLGAVQFFTETAKNKNKSDEERYATSKKAMELGITVYQLSTRLNPGWRHYATKRVFFLLWEMIQNTGAKFCDDPERDSVVLIHLLLGEVERTGRLGIVSGGHPSVLACDSAYLNLVLGQLQSKLLLLIPSLRNEFKENQNKIVSQAAYSLFEGTLQGWFHDGTEVRKEIVEPRDPYDPVEDINAANTKLIYSQELFRDKEYAETISKCYSIDFILKRAQDYLRDKMKNVEEINVKSIEEIPQLEQKIRGLRFISTLLLAESASELDKYEDLEKAAQIFHDLGFSADEKLCKSRMMIYKDQFNEAEKLLSQITGKIKEESKVLMNKIKKLLIQNRNLVESRQLLPYELRVQYLNPRVVSMKELLNERQANWNLVTENLATQMIQRNANGWLLPPKEDSSLPNMELGSFSGFTLNLETGEITFEFAKNGKKLLSWRDVSAVFQSGAGVPIFSLEHPGNPLEKPFHPFQSLQFSPPGLESTDYVDTMFQADYLLKFLVQGVEICSYPPFDVRPTTHPGGFLSSLPSVLAQAIRPVHERREHKSINEAHRFWIEAQEISYSQIEIGSSSIKYIFGDCNMVVKKHLLEKDDNGNLVDSKNDSKFSAEEDFARELTVNYNKLSKYFPILARLGELSKLSSMYRIVNNLIINLEKNIQSNEYKEGITKNIEEVLASIVSNLSSYPLTIDSPEIRKIIEDQVDSNIGIGYTRDQIRSSLRSQFSKELPSINARKRENIISDLKTVLKTSQEIINRHIDNFLRNKSYSSFAKDIADHLVDQEIQKFKQVRRNIENKCKFKFVDSSISPHQPLKPKTGFDWVPAAFSHPRENSFVYGGVNLTAQLKEAQNILRPPPTSSYSMSTSTLQAQRMNSVPNSVAQQQDNLKRFNDQQFYQAMAQRQKQNSYISYRNNQPVVNRNALGRVGENHVLSVYNSPSSQANGWSAKPGQIGNTNHGFDAIAIKKDSNGSIQRIHITETKATSTSNSNFHPHFGNTKGGVQTSSNWISHTLNRMHNAGGESRDQAVLIAQNLDKARVVLGVYQHGMTNWTKQDLLPQGQMNPNDVRSNLKFQY